MAVNYYLFGVGVASLVFGFVTNGRHVDALNEEQRLTFLREGSPAPYLGYLTMVLVGILVLVHSFFWIVVLCTAILLEAVLAAWLQNRHLRKLDIPETWIRQKLWVDLSFAIAGVCVIGSLVYPKLQLLARF